MPSSPTGRPTSGCELIDRLLERPEYADFWANKWADLLRPNPYRVGIKAVFNLDAWLRDAFRRNKPYDQFVRELLTAQGSTFRNGAVVVFRDRREPAEITTMVSQLFLGIRLDCASLPSSSVRGLGPGRLLQLWPPISRGLAARASACRRPSPAARRCSSPAAAAR